MSEDKKPINMDVDSLLDGTLDDLADIPEFKLYPVGVHRVTIGFSIKNVADKKQPDAVEVGFKGLETVELANPTEDTPISAGQTAAILCFLKHEKPTVAEFGQGKYKEIMAAMAMKFGEGKTNRELMEEAQGAECLISIGIRYKKGDMTKKYNDLIAVEVV